MTSAHKTVVVMPAYNAAQTLVRTVRDLPTSHVDEVILVDDASQDETLAVAQDLARLSSIPFTSVRLPKNRGYGGNQKECYRRALARGADIVVMIHPDYQYDPRLTKHLVEFIRDGYMDVMLGSRIRSRAEALAGGMPAYKYVANRVLTFLQNLASGRNLSEWHTGMRAYRRAVLEELPLDSFSDDFIFDQQVLFAIIERGFTIGDLPVPVRYFKEASSIGFRRSVRYGLLTLIETAQHIRRVRRQACVYLVVGATAFAANQLAYALLIYGLGVWYLAAGMASFCIGGVIGFLLHKFWTFRGAQAHRAPRQLVAYTLVTLGNLGLTAGLLYLFVDGLAFPALLANVLATALVACAGFFLYKHLVFRSVRAPLSRSERGLQAVSPQ